MEFESILNKILEITDKNLKIQSEFVTAIYELKIKLDSDNYSKEDLKKYISDLSITVNQMYTLMNQTSNKEILTLLQTFKDDKAQNHSAFQSLVKSVEEMKICNDENESEIAELNRSTASILEKVKASNNLYKAVVALMTILTLAVGGIQLVNKLHDSERNDKIDSFIKEIKGKMK